MGESGSRRVVLGGALVVLGVLLLVGKRMHLGDSFWLIALGSMFLLGYFGMRSYGMLIPGGILTGLGVGAAAGHTGLGLGLGFISIFLIDTLIYRKGTNRSAGTSHWWPLIPGLIITGDAVTDLNPSFFGSWTRVLGDWWPLVLVLLGGLLLVPPLMKKKPKED